MTEILALLRNRNFIFVLAVFCGIAGYHGADWTEPLVIPMLAIVMTISALGIPNDAFRPFRHLIVPALKGVLMSYAVSATVILLLSAALIQDESLWKGFVLVAAVPPAVAVIPFVEFLEGNRSLALLGTAGAYLAALAIMPMLTVGLIGETLLDIGKLITVMTFLIIIPLVISRFLLWKGWHKLFRRPSGLITNWSFFIVLYTIVGLNRTALVSNPRAIFPVILISFTTLFVTGYAIEKIAKFYRIPQETITALNLLGTLKNYGLSGGLALAFINREAALPSAIGTIFLILYVIYLDFRYKTSTSS
ncbi:MAG: hypothetical protein CSYNP_01456 [Syntrophus sp. SKADARSKE-3]|nr:hypothetical protein [Syntrophus sp. SKADARSKE-3]